MPHGKDKWKQRAKTREALPDPRPRSAPPIPGPRFFKVTLQKVDADDLLKLEVERQHNQMLLCRVYGLASEVREIKHLGTEPPEIKIRMPPPTDSPRVENLNLERGDAMNTIEPEIKIPPVSYRDVLKKIRMPPPTDAPRVDSRTTFERGDAKNESKLIPPQEEIDMEETTLQLRANVARCRQQQLDIRTSLERLKIPPQEAIMKRVNTSLETELHIRSHICSILEDVANEVSKMEHLLTVPRTPSDELIIQEEIMIRLPVKSLARFRCVSRSWKSLIDSPEFIRAHKNQPKYLLVEYIDKDVGGERYACFADDDSPHPTAFPELPPSIKRLNIVGSCYGLLCLRYYETVVIWNPRIRKSIAIHMPPKEELNKNDRFFAFGVCPLTLDPTIVYITHLCPPQTRRPEPDSNKHWKVQVYKLSSGKFRNLSITSGNLPGVSKRIVRSRHQVFIDRLVYWCALVDLEDATARNLIMSFDITDEKFQEMEVPKALATLEPYYLSLSNRRESLLILERSTKSCSYHVWKMMGHGVFTQLFTTIDPPPASLTMRLLGFRNTGGPVMAVDVVDGSQSTSQLVVYKPNSEKLTDLLLLSDDDSYSMESYMETLLLIGQSDCISY